MARCNEKLGRFQKADCIRMKGHAGLPRARWQGLGRRRPTEWREIGAACSEARRRPLRAGGGRGEERT